MRKPGEWNTYDIIYTAPTFKKDRTYRTPPYIGFPEVKEHGPGPIRLQDHGDIGQARRT